MVVEREGMETSSWLHDFNQKQSPTAVALFVGRAYLIPQIKLRTVNQLAGS